MIPNSPFRQKHILLLSPYHGGSHQAWAEGYQRNSRHAVELLTLPQRFWKWRMHGGSVTLAREVMTHPTLRNSLPDLILATDMLDLTTFVALTRRHTGAIPVVIYMHENQLTYPLPADGTKGPMRRQLGQRDQHLVFINYASMLAADMVFFNSKYHQDSFFESLPSYLRHFPDYNELPTIDLIHAKSEVLPVGVDFQRLGLGHEPTEKLTDLPLILWNQRVEYDKNPLMFARVLSQLAEEGFTFRVAICGERFGNLDPELLNLLDRLGDRAVFNDYANDEVYRKILHEATVTLSIADHEFFGISILEAIYCGVYPVLPARLSYPELLPASHHEACLYKNFPDMLAKIRWALTNPAAARLIANELAHSIARYDWRMLAPRYDVKFESLMA